jgi:hypothetical protein
MVKGKKKVLKVVSAPVVIKKKKKLKVVPAPVVKKKKKLKVVPAPVVKKKKKLVVKDAEELRQKKIEQIKQEIRDGPEFKPFVSIKGNRNAQPKPQKTDVKRGYDDLEFFKMILDTSPQVKLHLNNNEFILVKVLNENDYVALYTPLGDKVGILKKGITFGRGGLTMNDLALASPSWRHLLSHW